MPGDRKLNAAQRAGVEASQRDAALLRALREAGAGGLSAKEAAERCGAAERTIRRALERVVQGGNAEKRGARWYAFTEAVAVEDASVLAPILVALPTREHAALFRLLCGTVVARYTLGSKLKTGWPSCIIYGPTGAFKTALGVVMGAMAGLSEPEVVRVIGLETGKSLFGRRTTLPGGTVTFLPSPYLARPIMILDEADKPPDALRQNIFYLLLGDSAMKQEDRRFTMKATALVTFNEEKLPKWLHPATLRRSFVLDANLLAPRQAVDTAARRLFAVKPPVLPLGSLTMPAEVSSDDQEYLASLITPYLKDASTFDARFASRPALGLVALYGCGMRRALAMVAHDVLTIARGNAKAGWQARLAPLLSQGDGGAPLALPAVIDTDNGTISDDAEAVDDNLDAPIDYGRLWTEYAVQGAHDGQADGIANAKNSWVSDTDCPVKHQQAPFNDDGLRSILRVHFSVTMAVLIHRQYGPGDCSSVYHLAHGFGYAHGYTHAWGVLDAKEDKRRLELVVECAKLRYGGYVDESWWSDEWRERGLKELRRREAEERKAEAMQHAQRERLAREQADQRRREEAEQERRWEAFRKRRAEEVGRAQEEAAAARQAAIAECAALLLRGDSVERFDPDVAAEAHLVAMRALVTLEWAKGTARAVSTILR